MPHAFLSYAREDAVRAEQIAAAFRANGISVWFDVALRPGKPYDRAIETALDTADCVIVLWSTASVCSEWVRNEAAEGLARGVLLPVFVEPVRVPLEFRRLHTIDLTDWRGQPEDPRFRTLCDEIRTLTDHSGAAPALQSHLSPPVAVPPRERPSPAPSRTSRKARPLAITIVAVVAVAAYVLLGPLATRFWFDAARPDTSNEPQKESPSVTVPNVSDKRVEAVDQQMLKPLGAEQEKNLVAALNKNDARATRAVLQKSKSSGYDIGPALRTVFGKGEEFYYASNYQRAAIFYEIGSDFGDPEAAASLGYLYANGRGVPFSQEKALALYRTSAATGNASGLANLAWAMETGFPGTQKNMPEILDMYRRAAAIRPGTDEGRFAEERLAALGASTRRQGR